MTLDIEKSCASNPFYRLSAAEGDKTLTRYQSILAGGQVAALDWRSEEAKAREKQARKMLVAVAMAPIASRKFWRGGKVKPHVLRLLGFADAYGSDFLYFVYDPAKEKEQVADLLHELATQPAPTVYLVPDPRDPSGSRFAAGFRWFGQDGDPWVQIVALAGDTARRQERAAKRWRRAWEREHPQRNPTQKRQRRR